MDILSDKLHSPSARFLSHLIFWVAYLTFSYFQQTYGIADIQFADILKSMAITLPVDVIATYTTVYYLLPKMLFKKKYGRFILVFIFLATVFVLAQQAVLYYIVIPYIYPEFKTDNTFFEFNYLSRFLTMYTVVGIFMAFKLLKTWYENQNRQIALQNKNLDSELAMLRNQVNPHFLFNTLNNIDTLIKTDTDKASEYLIKLSEIMRYMIYDSNCKLVALDKEISYLSSYIELQRIRLNDPAVIDFVVTGDPAGKMIAPVLLVPPIENAFKHAYKKNLLKSILIKLEVEDSVLRLLVQNNVKRNGIQQKDSASGIGLENLRRRLDLLYGNEHELDINQESDLFTVKLKIPLNEN